MFRLSLTHKAIYTLIVFTLFCCVGHLTAERTQRADTAAISAPFQEGGAYLMEIQNPVAQHGHTRGKGLSAFPLPPLGDHPLLNGGEVAPPFPAQQLSSPAFRLLRNASSPLSPSLVFFTRLLSVFCRLLDVNPCAPPSFSRGRPSDVRKP